MSKKKNFEQLHSRQDLRGLCFRLKGFAYLLKNQKLDPAPPLDAEDIAYGIGSILEDITENIQGVLNEIEEQELNLIRERKK